MLLGGKGGCQQCTCVPCDACTATCTQPHTGGAFATVYTRYFASVEAGNTTDGYLTATGDSDTSDPYDGMDGTGPWYQRVSGGFTLGGSTPGTRFPCSVRVSFWRNNYTLGASTIPPPGSTLTENTIEVIVTSGSLVTPDGQVITAADGAVAVSSVPLVSAGGDASGSDPRSGDGTVSFSAQCWNVETIFTIRATIRWNVKKRQHVLYGKVRECYEESSPPSGCCPTGKTLRSSLYVTISGYSYPGGNAASSSSVNGTYIVQRSSEMCNAYSLNVSGACALPGDASSMWYFENLYLNATRALNMLRYTPRGDSGCVFTLLQSDEQMVDTCDGGTVPIFSGTGKVYRWDGFSGIVYTQVGTFNWKVES